MSIFKYRVSSLLTTTVLSSSMMLMASIDVQAQSNNQNANNLDQIIVTTDQLVEDAQKAPASITVLDHQTIKDSGISSVQELSKFAPNIHLSNQGSSRFTVNSIRGISETVHSDYFNSAVGIYLDGIPLSNAEYSRTLGDIEYAEILRGPQGTLYGRSSLAGVINLTSRAPSDKFGGEASATYGNNGQLGGSVMVNGPIAQNLFGRLFFDYMERDGFTDYLSSGDDVDDLDTYTGSGSLQFTPGEKTKITLSGSIEKRDEGGYAYAPFNDYKTRKVDLVPKNEENRDSYSGALTVTHDFDFAKFTSITGLRSFEVESFQDLNYNPATHATYMGGKADSIEEGDQFSQEFRLSGKGLGGDLKWLVGAFYQKDEVDYTYNYFVPAFGPTFVYTSNYKREEFAGFGEVTAKVFSNIELTAGLRVSTDRHDMENNSMFSGKDDYNKVTPKFSAAYHFDNTANEEKFVYASITRGARSGGFNRLSADDRFETEYLWAHEVGFKSQWMGSKLVINAAAFYNDWTNQQISTYPSPGVIAISNAGESHSQGIEIDAQWRPINGLELSGFLGLTTGEYDVYTPDQGGGVDLSGNKLINMPKTTAGAAIQYRFPIKGFPLETLLRAEYKYTGEQFFDPENRLKQSGYGLVNIRAGIEADNFSATFFVKNLFDKDYRTNGYSDFAFYDIAIAGETRLFGITLNTKF